MMLKVSHPRATLPLALEDSLPLPSLHPGTIPEITTRYPGEITFIQIIATKALGCVTKCNNSPILFTHKPLQDLIQGGVCTSMAQWPNEEMLKSFRFGPNNLVFTYHVDRCDFTQLNPLCFHIVVLVLQVIPFAFTTFLKTGGGGGVGDGGSASGGRGATSHQPLATGAGSPPAC